MEEIYATMSETVLQGLRRRLPVTRVKFACYTWEGRTRHTGPESDTRGMRGSNSPEP